MSAFDPSDPPEPDPEEERAHYERQEALNSPVTITGLTVASIQSILEGAVEGYFYRRSNIGDGIEGKFDRVMGEAVAKLVTKVGGEHLEQLVRAEVERAMGEGFRSFNTYNGRPEGEPVTLRKMVEALLTKKTSEGYNKPETTFVERVARETVQAHLSTSFGSIVTEAKAKFQAAVDDVLKAKFAEAMKAALGIR